MFRRAEVREQDAMLRNAHAINDKVRLLAKLGTALIEARNSGADLNAAVDAAVGWDKLARNVEEAERLARPDKADLPALAARAWPVLPRAWATARTKGSYFQAQSARRRRPHPAHHLPQGACARPRRLPPPHGRSSSFRTFGARAGGCSGSSVEASTYVR